MAHIASCMAEAGSLDKANMNGNIHLPSKPPSPAPSLDSTTTTPSEQKPFVWRMQQSSADQRKYQLFPKDRQPQHSSNRSLDPEQARAFALGHNGGGERAAERERATNSNGLKIRIKEHNLVRRRKVSVPELGPMTTVQEVAMDSPTIPGRHPIHERSISAPGNSSRHHYGEENITTFSIADALEETDETEKTPSSPRASPHKQESTTSEAARQPMSPKDLAPLVIPSSQPGIFSGLTRQLSLSRLRSGTSASESNLRSAAARGDDSPKTRTPYTPLTGTTATTTPMTSTSMAPTMPTPVSAPITESRFSPTPWDANATACQDSQSRAAALGHRRGASDTGSIMERGRPRKRSERKNNSVDKIAEAKRSRSVDKKMFEELPTGHKVADAVTALSQTEIVGLQKQAYGQASRFEVLKQDEVDALSKELRQLDERTEYLRRTYNSLRAGRRNLHSRICQYLRSPRVARFSTDSMLKQEEALAELDTSIDDWVTKLEQAENRRSRVRQKLLEHVAAAAILPTAGAAAASENLQQAMGIKSPAQASSAASAPTSSTGLGNMATPPRSPTKSSSPRKGSDSPSPQRVVAQVPSTIMEQPGVEEAATGLCQSDREEIESAVAAQRRADVESIRIYADRDVYSLLADVEEEITKMGASPREGASTPMSENERSQLHRARSHELLLHGRSKDLNAKSETFSPRPASPTKAATTPAADASSQKENREPAASADSGAIFLTNAVFKG